MEVYNSQYLHLAFFAEEELIEMTWMSATERMSVEEYKQEFLNYLDLILLLRPKKVLVDTRNSFFPVAPDLQEWTNETIFPSLLAIGLDKGAIVMSSEMIPQLSIEQMMEEAEGVKFVTRYFDDKEEAKRWLLSL